MFDLYREAIIDHGQHVRNLGLLDPADVDHEEANPVCGDRLRLTLRFGEEDRVAAVGWEGEGCIICLAAASLLGEAILGQTRAQLDALARTDLFALLGITVSPVREKCALLAFRVLKRGVFGPDGWRDEDV